MTKILVIDDAEPLRNDIIEMLSFEGFDVVGAENGSVGVDLARSYQPDLIICDIMMPELNGYEVLNELRQDQTTIAIPFIFLTAKTDRADMRQGMGLGADDFLTKPFVATELLATVQARLEKREALQSIADTRLKELSDSIITALPHELRTPLNSIIGFSDMLISEADSLSPENVTEWATHISESAQRLYRLVENYIDYVRAEVAIRNPSRMESLKNKKTDRPGAIIDLQARQKAEKTGRLDDLELALCDEHSVNISDNELAKIIEELVDNAVRYSEPNSPIYIKTYIKDDRYYIAISDEGRGMTPDQLKSVGVYIQFERWLQDQQSSGLGLAIVKRLVEMYGGELTIDSESGNGTRISLYLRLLPN
jgi:signal transduction histidine kinase